MRRATMYFSAGPAASGPSDEHQVVRDYLSALVRAWEADHVSVSPLTFLKAQRHKTPQVRVGWMTYIRDNVTLDTSLVPEEVHIEAGDGGRYPDALGDPARAFARPGVGDPRGTRLRHLIQH